MKNSKYILIIVGVVLVGLLGLIKTPEKSSSIKDSDIGDVCYVWNNDYGDRATLKMSYLGEDDVSGFFNYRPKEKDSKVGTFVGKLGPINMTENSSVASLIWDSQAEGMNAKEELSVILSKDAAKIGFGEMKDSGGVYVYANPDNISYSLVLDRVECSDSNVEIPGFESDINITNASAS
jgi:hypothetical protein